MSHREGAMGFTVGETQAGLPQPSWGSPIKCLTLGVKLNIHCQLDWIWNHHDEQVWDFSENFN